MTELDIEFVRNQFEVFDDPERASWANFENAGGSYVPRQVTDRLNHLFTKVKVQPYGLGPQATEAGEAMDRSRQALADMINAELGELSVGPSTSQNTYVLAAALRPEMATGDEVVVTNQDHEANSGVWRRLADTGIIVREWGVDPATGLLDVADLNQLLSDRTKLVCLPHCSNIAGTVNAVGEVAALARSVGGRAVVDGVAWAPHAYVDVKALDVDFYLFSTYKTYGPHLGVLYAKAEHLERVANQGHFFNEAKLTSRLTPAGPQHVELGAAEGIVEYFLDLDTHHFGGRSEADGVGAALERVFGLFAEHEQMVMTPILDVLNERSDVQVVGATRADRSVRAPTIAFRSSTRTSAEIVSDLIAAKISCANDHFYAYRLLQAMNIDVDDGVVRLSAVHYNTVDEAERVALALESALPLS